MKKLICLLLCACFVFGFAACGETGNGGNGGNTMEVGYWELRTPDATYTLAQLAELTDEQLKALENKYIRMTEVELGNDISLTQLPMYYVNSVRSIEIDAANSQGRIMIVATSYQNYWEIPYKAGETVSIEGYVYPSGTKSRFLINPCHVTKPRA